MIIVPEAILDINKERVGEIGIKQYTSNVQRERTQIQLTHNTFVFLLGGQKTIYTEYKVFNIDAPGFFALRKGHYLMAERYGKEQEKYNSYLFFFTDKQIDSFLQKYTPSTIPSENLIEKVAVFNFHRDYADWLHQFKRYGDHNVLKYEYVTHKLEELLIMMLTKEKMLKAFLSSFRYRDEHTNFKKIVESQIVGQVSLNDLAFLNNMSLSTFKRRFKEVYHVSPGKYMHQKKMEKAREDIVFNRFTGTEIFADLGHESYSSFITAFKKQFGLSPQEYKKMMSGS